MSSDLIRAPYNTAKVNISEWMKSSGFLVNNQESADLAFPCATAWEFGVWMLTLREVDKENCEFGYFLIAKSKYNQTARDELFLLLDLVEKKVVGVRWMPTIRAEDSLIDFMPHTQDEIPLSLSIIRGLKNLRSTYFIPGPGDYLHGEVKDIEFKEAANEWFKSLGLSNDSKGDQVDIEKVDEIALSSKEVKIDDIKKKLIEWDLNKGKAVIIYFFERNNMGQTTPVKIIATRFQKSPKQIYKWIELAKEHFKSDPEVLRFLVMRQVAQKGNSLE
jgi:hypothetical protein